MYGAGSKYEWNWYLVVSKIDQTTVGRNFFSYISFFLTVLQPKWLSSNIIGHLASPDFIRKSRSSGFYTSHELKSVTSWEAVENILPILESLGLCAKVSIYSSSSTILFKVQALLEEKLEITWKRMPLMVLFFLGSTFFSLASLADDFTQGAKLGIVKVHILREGQLLEYMTLFSTI